MPMQNLLNKSKKLKKSQTLLIGSLLVFGGIVFLSGNYLMKMREQVFSDMKIAMMGPSVPAETTPGTPDDPAIVPETPGETYEENYTFDYSIYYGVLEIPKIWLKRGFYNVGSRYNSIKYNVTMVDGSTMPGDGVGNLILMAHSGDSYISFFANLYRLGIGDDCYITQNGVQYHYQIVNIYEVQKSGMMVLNYNPEAMTLTLVTCTKDNDSLQTVYVAEYAG